MLRGDLVYAGDLGGRSPRSDRKDRWDLEEPFVRVLGCHEPTESTLLVKLGSIGEGASTLSSASTGSGEDALGIPKPK